MLNKRKNICLLFLCALCNLYGLNSYKTNKDNYKKIEYDLADYISHADGYGEVYINNQNEKDTIVELYFFTSLYKGHYYFQFFENNFEGFFEKYLYKEQYELELSTKEVVEEFEGNIFDISKLSNQTQKYLTLSVELIKESLN